MNTDRFRFRVWDKKDEEYLDPDYYEEFAITQDGVIHVGLTVENGICDEFQSFRPESLIVEQCTGLKDRKGKLIYEGDVVKQTYKDGTNLCTEVFYNTELCRWYLRKPYPNLHAVEYMVWDFYGSIADSLEVIGNIHESEVEDE